MNREDHELENIVRDYGRIRLKEQLENTHQKWQRQKRNLRLLYIGLGLLLLTLLAWLSLKPNSNQPGQTPIAQTQALYEQYFEVYPIQNLRSTDVTPDSSWNSIVQNYRAERFDDCIPLLRNLADENSQAKLYLACALLETDQFDEAQVLLADLQQSNIYREDANWYLALLYLQKGDSTKTKELLEGLSQNASYGARATIMMEEL